MRVLRISQQVPLQVIVARRAVQDYRLCNTYPSILFSVDSIHVTQENLHTREFVAHRACAIHSRRNGSRPLSLLLALSKCLPRQFRRPSSSVVRGFKHRAVRGKRRGRNLRSGYKRQYNVRWKLQYTRGCPRAIGFVSVFSLHCLSS